MFFCFCEGDASSFRSASCRRIVTEMGLFFVRRSVSPTLFRLLALAGCVWGFAVPPPFPYLPTNPSPYSVSHSSSSIS